MEPLEQSRGNRHTPNLKATLGKLAIQVAQDSPEEREQHGEVGVNRSLMPEQRGEQHPQVDQRREPGGEHALNKIPGALPHLRPEIGRATAHVTGSIHV